MAEIPGRARRAERLTALMPFHLRILIPERLSVGMGSLSEQQMAEPIGLTRRVGPASFFMVFPLPMQITGRLSVRMAPFLEQEMGSQVVSSAEWDNFHAASSTQSKLPKQGANTGGTGDVPSPDATAGVPPQLSGANGSPKQPELRHHRQREIVPIATPVISLEVIAVHSYNRTIRQVGKGAADWRCRCIANYG